MAAQTLVLKTLEYPISIVEVKSFSRDADRLLTQEALHSIVDFVALHPSAGDLIPDSGGLRILRWARDGKGKRAGVRVVYYFRDLNMPLYMLAIYGKGEKSHLSAGERRLMKKLVDNLVESHFQRLLRSTDRLRPA